MISILNAGINHGVPRYRQLIKSDSSVYQYLWKGTSVQRLSWNVHHDSCVSCVFMHTLSRPCWFIIRYCMHGVASFQFYSLRILRFCFCFISRKMEAKYKEKKQEREEWKEIETFTNRIITTATKTTATRAKLQSNQFILFELFATVRPLFASPVRCGRYDSPTHSRQIPELGANFDNGGVS